MAWVGAAISVVGGLLAADNSSTTANAAQAAAQLQYDIADRVQKRAEYLYSVWQSYYLKNELELNAEIAALPKYKADYNTAQQKAVTQVRRQFARARRQALACLPVHCVGAYCAMTKELAFAEASASAWATNAAIRTEDEKEFVRAAQRRGEQYRQAAFGRQSYQASNADSLAAQIYGQVAGNAAKAASSAAGATGYFLQQALGQFGKSFSDKPGQTQPPAPITQSPPSTVNNNYGQQPPDPASQTDPFADNSGLGAGTDAAPTFTDYGESL